MSDRRRYRLNGMSTHHAMMHTEIIDGGSPKQVAMAILQARPRAIKYVDVYFIPHNETYGKFLGSFTKYGWRDREQCKNLKQISSSPVVSSPSPESVSNTPPLPETASHATAPVSSLAAKKLREERRKQA